MESVYNCYVEVYIVAVVEESRTGGWRNCVMKSLLNSRRVDCVPCSTHRKNNEHECCCLINLKEKTAWYI
jgi:hypothetical protein